MLPKDLGPSNGRVNEPVWRRGVFQGGFIGSESPKLEGGRFFLPLKIGKRALP